MLNLLYRVFVSVLPLVVLLLWAILFVFGIPQTRIVNVWALRGGLVVALVAFVWVTGWRPLSAKDAKDAHTMQTLAWQLDAHRGGWITYPDQNVPAEMARKLAKLECPGDPNAEKRYVAAFCPHTE